MGYQEDWTAITTFYNSWQDYGGSYALRVRRIGGVVYLAGLIKSGNYEADAFLLPSGYRPLANERYFPVVGYSGTAYFLAFAYVHPNGTVRVTRIGGLPTQSGTYWLSLDSIFFIAEQ